MKQNLNLARKWRSKTFDTIVGQHLPVRMLKNSLYLGQFFPVYLFSGQRGCGKTTTARVFAAAINCEQLDTFRETPKKVVVPCQKCDSCIAMSNSNHPDFIEIDAASHTGVDNVRSIIDSSSFMPLSGKKKIYLIDEAHMLSKAAFNAFLKILEDPPESVVFMLATTDPQKIIGTVMSRSFQLFFTPIAHDDLMQHIRAICDTEHIKADNDALALIVRESEGSARDAINLLEQVRFSTEQVTVPAILTVLGHVSDTVIVQLLETIIMKSQGDVLQLLQEIKFETYSAERLYHKLVAFVRAALWMKHGLEPPADAGDPALLKTVVDSCSSVCLSSLLIALCDYEQAFLRTTKKHIMLELLLLRLCGNGQQVSVSPNLEPRVSTPRVAAEQFKKKESLNTNKNPAWSAFLTALNEKQDPLISSIFTQAQFISHDTRAHVIKIQFAKQFLFFKELLDEGVTVWQSVLKEHFGQEVHLESSFDRSEPVNESLLKKNIETNVQKIVQPKVRNARTVRKKKEIPLDVSDAQKWKKTTLVLQHFPGTVTEMVGESDEKTP